MNTKQKIKLLAPAFVLGLCFVAVSSGSVSAASNWNDLVKEECSGSTADAAERCEESLRNELKEKCGAPKDTQKYKDCRSDFIKNYGKKTNGGSGGNTIDGCGDIKTSLIKCNTDGGNPLMSILIQVINFMAIGVGIAVVGGIIWGGMMYASSNGDASKTKQAITIIVNAVVGLLLFIFMYAFINFLVPGGLFT